jgi:short-subunit dehydrogenase
MIKILVTGCSSGFGEDIAKRLLEDKNNFVIITMRNAESRDHAFKALNHENLKVLSLDITREEERENVANFVREELNGELDILINNAGLGFYGAFELTSEQELRDHLEVNFFATAIMIQKFLPFIRKSSAKHKKIINISSMLGQVGMPLSATYSASKHAVEGLVEGLHYELAPLGIEVTTICPGRHRTNFMKNIGWASLEDKDNVYTVQEENLKNLMKKFTNGKEIPLSNVSKKIINIMKSKKSPSRVYVGSDAIGLYLLRKLMPFNLFMGTIKNLYKRIILKRMSYENI